jgi:putative membrane protein
MMDRKKSTFMSIGISAALVAGAIWFLFDHRYNLWATGYWQMPQGMMIGGGAGFGILMLLFWVVVVVALVLLIAALFSGNWDHAISPPSESALEILQKRYARGEIDKAQYDLMRRDLETGETRK